MAFTRDELVARLTRAGELQVFGGDQAEFDSHFDTAIFRFHGPDGFDTDYQGLARYFKSVREAFDAELKHAQAVVLAYDGLNPHPPTYCYLKPYYLDPTVTYFEQVARGAL